MFDKEKFGNIIKKINDAYPSQYIFANDSKVNRTYLSQAINLKLSGPPKPDILNRIARASKGITSYDELMRVCGYVNENYPLSNKLQDNISLLPVYEKICNNLENSSNYIKDYWPYILPDFATEQWFYYIVPDDSMDLDFAKSDILLCYESNSIKNNEIGLFIINNKYDNSVIVRKYKQKDNLIILEPKCKNSNYDIEIVSKEDLKIIAKVLSVNKQLQKLN